MLCKEKRQKEMTKKLLNEYSYVPAHRHITRIFSQKMNEYMELIAFGEKEGIIIPSHNRAGASPGSAGDTGSAGRYGIPSPLTCRDSSPPGIPFPSISEAEKKCKGDEKGAGRKTPCSFA